MKISAYKCITEIKLRDIIVISDSVGAIGSSEYFEGNNCAIYRFCYDKRMFLIVTAITKQAH